MSESNAKPRGRPFAKGASPNPHGRPSFGMTKLERLRKCIRRKDEREIIEKVVAKALGGDLKAVELLWNRMYPALKPIEQAVAFNLPVNAALAEQSRAVLQATAAGDLAPSQGSALMVGLGSHVRIVEVDEVVREVAEIKSVLAERGIVLHRSGDTPEPVNAESNTSRGN